jgi:aminoglycoside/choline kinase family phosphotransferase
MEMRKMTVSSVLQDGKTALFEDERSAKRYAFLKTQGLENESLLPLPGDASGRCYFRLPQALLMDDPSNTQDTVQFQLISDLLQGCGLSAPKIYEADHLNGFLLIEDWGDQGYRKTLSEIPEKTLYKETIRSLIHLHQNLSEHVVGIPFYDRDLFLEKACLFTEWTEAPLSNTQKSDFKHLWKTAYDYQPQVPHSLALRDVMVDNLIWLPERSGMNRSGFIDFQDASWSPIAYDLFSLLRDARRDVDPDLANEMLKLYLKAFPNVDHEDFYTSYYLWGAQRTSRILGVFYRLARRDGKPQYLQYVPRLKQSLEICLAHPTLKDLKEWFKQVTI